MKKIAVISIILILTSCTSTKKFNQNTDTKINCVKYNFKDNKIFLQAKIDDVPKTFLFDTGANVSAITNAEAVSIANKKINTSGKTMGADKKKIDLNTISSKFESDLFYSANKTFLYVPNPKKKCKKLVDYDGIIGMDVFFDNDNPLMLDFSNGNICNITQSQKEELIKSNYVQVKASCVAKEISLFLKVDHEEIKFIIDTGFNGSISIPFSAEKKLSKYKSLTMEGSLMKFLSTQSNAEEIFYENVPIENGNFKLNSIVMISQSSKFYHVGIGYIKGFDWIIDYKNNKVYVKKSTLEIDSVINKDVLKYFVSEANDKLIVSIKQKFLNKYRLGDQIISINSKKVTLENICEMQDLLNKTINWDILNLEVIPAKTK